jgi:hypothetical protein
MKDRTTKIILAFIAAGLWMNALVPVFNPKPVAAQDPATLQKIEDDLSGIKGDFHKVASGLCLNNKICD